MRTVEKRWEMKIAVRSDVEFGETREHIAFGKRIKGGCRLIHPDLAAQAC